MLKSNKAKVGSKPLYKNLTHIFYLHTNSLRKKKMVTLKVA
jgi:hypothetical protein